MGVIKQCAKFMGCRHRSWSSAGPRARRFGHRGIPAGRGYSKHRHGPGGGRCAGSVRRRHQHGAKKRFVSLLLFLFPFSKARAFLRQLEDVRLRRKEREQARTVTMQATEHGVDSHCRCFHLLRAPLRQIVIISDTIGAGEEWVERLAAMARCRGQRGQREQLGRQDDCVSRAVGRHVHSQWSSGQ